MNEVFINALVARIRAGDMTIVQVPIPFRVSVGNKLQEES